MPPIIVRLATLLGLFALLIAGNLHAADPRLTAYVFWQEGCPYCKGAIADLETLAKADPSVTLRAIELGSDEQAERLYEAALAHFGYDQAAVPLVIIGKHAFLGYFDGGRSATQYSQAIRQCLDRTCADTILALQDSVSSQRAGANRTAVDQRQEPDRLVLPEVIDLPLIGPVKPADLSLTALTIVFAAIDGFNPCAMWVLVFLIGLLLGLEDEKRMWLLGGAFLGATAVMYFAVMTAWLNLVLFLGAISWLRIAIGLLALGGGFYFLREYWTKPEAVCHVTNPGRRQKIMAAFRAAVHHKQLLLSVVGIMALAVLVNLVELLCSAGIPAVYSQILAMNNLPPVANYAYVSLYIAIFMLDDVAIFATAMLALRVAGLTGKYARYSHLIGGVLLLVIGAVMLLRPELLSFA